MKTITVSILMLFFVASCSSVQEDTIKVGAIAALSGNLAVIGQEERIGLDIAISEINEAGGVNGKRLEVIWEDDACDNKKATNSAQKLIAVDNVNVIFGSTCTGTSMSAAAIAEENKVILMSAVTSGSVFSDAGDFAFRTNPVDNTKDLVDYLFSQQVKDVAILSAQNDFAQSLRADFVRFVEQAGGVIVSDESYTIDEVDFRLYLSKMKQAAPDAYFLNVDSGKTGIIIARQAKELGLTPLFGNRGFEAARPEDDPVALEGIVIYGTAGVVDESSAKAQKLFDAYEEQTGKIPFCAFCVASSYDRVYVVAKAMGVCGVDAECMKNWLYEMPPYEGVIGSFVFDERGDPQGVKYGISVFRDGKLVPLSSTY
ncbi:hypothetical protein COV18_01290 [Candidatus Woesearchaeota archaeon CG10_big_fil_rev_8_21_14_0_10_37_12]|nr:MAG: hypothetical protein COV18_01290 [Candidatus Woesearchaeota archaeon CG10_big_fil_rev_8_21_14_0_10_37_12]